MTMLFSTQGLLKFFKKENYDYRLGQPILWEPAPTPRGEADNGATVQAEKA